MTIMNKLVPIAALISLGVAAASDNPWYVGARVGITDYSSFDLPLSDSAYDDQDWGGGVFIGYKINNWLGIEGGYTYLGEADYNGPSDGFKVQGMDFVGKFTWQVQPNFDLFLKAGGYWFDADNQFLNQDDNDVSATAGVGAEYYFNDNWSTRLEYQYYDDVGSRDTGKSNIHFYGLSLVYGWGAPAVAAIIPPDPEPVPEPKPAPLPVEPVIIGEVAAILPFDFDSDEMTAEDIAKIQPVADQLVKYPQTKLYVVGHTDSRGSEEYNQALSEERAASVISYLVEQFSIQRDRIIVEGRGELEPMASNDSEEGRAMNRRVEVFVPKFELAAE